jgi:rRNA maturation endonuclease Nob1
MNVTIEKNVPMPGQPTRTKMLDDSALAAVRKRQEARGKEYSFHLNRHIKRGNGMTTIYITIRWKDGQGGEYDLYFNTEVHCPHADWINATEMIREDSPLIRKQPDLNRRLHKMRDDAELKFLLLKEELERPPTPSELKEELVAEFRTNGRKWHARGPNDMKRADAGTPREAISVPELPSDGRKLVPAGNLFSVIEELRDEIRQSRIEADALREKLAERDNINRTLNERIERLVNQNQQARDRNSELDRKITELQKNGPVRETKVVGMKFCPDCGHNMQQYVK